MSTIRVVKNRKDHFISIHIEDIKKLGCEKSIILGIVEYFGTCQEKKLQEILTFIHPNEISRLLKEMQEQGYLGVRNE